MADRAGTHWYGATDVQNILNMAERFIKSGISLYDEMHFSGNGMPDDRAGNYRLDDCSIEEALEEGHIHYDKDHGAGKFNPVLNNVKAAGYAHARNLGSNTAMEKYVSENPNFNSQLRNFPGVIVIADVLDHFERLGMGVELNPLYHGKRIKPISNSDLRELMPGFEGDFSDYRKGKGNMLNSMVYAILDGNVENIDDVGGKRDMLWVRPLAEHNGKSIYANHYLYSPGSKGPKFLDFVNMFLQVERVAPAFGNLRDSYLKMAEALDSRWQFV